MQKYSFNDLNDFLSNWKYNSKYFEMLVLVSSLSKLFSENSIPYIDYRVTENLFCKYYNAINDARSCTAYDAHFGKLGIGIKTFVLKKGGSIEKIAEFNKLRSSLNGLKGIDLARKLGEFRNERMRFANDSFGIEETQYHIVGRKSGLLKIFNSPYETVDIENIQEIKEIDSSLHFNDGKNHYVFNKSKSVLQKRFVIPNDTYDIPVEIIEDPLSLLEKLLINNKNLESTNLVKKKDVLIPTSKPIFKGIDFVILPLYSTVTKEVPLKSGLNQWNAGGRAQNENEIYIPIPKHIHNNYPNFFPSRDIPFRLYLPDGSFLSAKVCQDGGKALMSNPNKELGEWLLRKILHKKPGSLVTKFDLDRLGIDSVMIEKAHHKEDDEFVYKISFQDNYENYEDFSRII